MTDHKFTENPFSSRKPPAQNVNRTMALSPRSRWLAPFAYTVAFVACGLIATAFSSSLPNNPVVLTPLSSQADRQPFRPAGLRGQTSLKRLGHTSDESPPKASVKPLSDEEDDIDEDEADSDHDPQYIMPLRKFLGTRQQAAQREHHEIHDQVQDHIFGQNRSGSTVEIEEDPSVIIKDWDSDSEDAEDEVKTASKETTKEDKEEVETASITKEEEDVVSKKKH